MMMMMMLYEPLMKKTQMEMYVGSIVE